MNHGGYTMTVSLYRLTSGGVLGTTMLLAACAPQSDYFNSVNKGTGQPPADTCGASGFAYLVGQPASILDAIVIPEPKRIIPAGAPVTADYSPERLNIWLDVSNTITRVSCD